MFVCKYNNMLHLTKRLISLEGLKHKQNPKDFGREGDDLLGDSVSFKNVS